MYIWSWKNKKIVLSTLKIAFLPKHFTKMYKFWIKLEFCTQNVHLVLKKTKQLKKVFAKKFHQNVQILDKNWSFYQKCTFHQNVQILDKNVLLDIWSWKKKKIVLFTVKIKFLLKNFTKMYKFWIKTGVLYLKMYIWSWKNKKIVLFTLRIKFLQKNLTKMYKFWIKTGVSYPKLHFEKTKKLKVSFCQKISPKCTNVGYKLEFRAQNVHLVLKKQNG